MKYLKSYNESVRDHLKPKSEEEIRKSIEKLSPDEMLYYALTYELLDLLKQAEDKGVDIHKKNEVCLRHVCMTGNLDIFKYIVEKGADIHAHNDSCIRLSSSNGYFEITKILVEMGANIHVENETPLRFALTNNHLDIAKYLIDNGANINKVSKWAHETGNITVMKRIKEINSTNESVRDHLKPKSEEEIKIAMKKFDGMEANEKIFYILEHDLMFLFSNDEIKEMMSQADPINQIDHIFSYGLNDDLYSEEEIKEITIKADPDDQIVIIYEWGLCDHLFSKDYVKNLVYKEYIDSYDRLETIYNRYTDELDGIFDDDDIKKIVNQDTDDPERMIRNIEEFNLNGMYTSEEIKDIINKIDNIHDRLLCIFNYDMYENFESKEIVKMFKSLSYDEQENLISFDELYDMLPRSITKKFDG